jgi:transcriptional regulator with XRE-family HTH domain
MSEIPTIGDVVREWRQYWQISLTDFCQQTKLSKGYVSELEHNKIDNPKKDKLKILAKALRITEMDIVSRRMPPKDGAAQSTPSSKQGIAGQGNQEDSPVPPPSILAVAGIAAAPSGINQEPREQGRSINREVGQILDEYALPFAESELALQLIRAATRAICETLKAKLEDRGNYER